MTTVESAFAVTKKKFLGRYKLGSLLKIPSCVFLKHPRITLPSNNFNSTIFPRNVSKSALFICIPLTFFYYFKCLIIRFFMTIPFKIFTIPYLHIPYIGIIMFSTLKLFDSDIRFFKIGIY